MEFKGKCEVCCVYWEAHLTDGGKTSLQALGHIQKNGDCDKDPKFQAMQITPPKTNFAILNYFKYSIKLKKEN